MACCISTGSNSSTHPSDEEQAHGTSMQSMVTCTYRAHIAGSWRYVTVSWSKNLMNYSLSMSMESVEGNRVYTCEIVLKYLHFWGKKGYKRFEVDGNQLDVYWDLRSAKFSGCPEPTSDFYVAVLSQQEMVLLLGDNEKKAYKRLKAQPAHLDSAMVYKKVHVFSKKIFCTKAKFDQKRREHIFAVESSVSGHGDPEMWIRIDGIVLIHVENLQWKFRGNQMVLIDKHQVNVLWDVHAWLFGGHGTDQGVFIFKTGRLQEPDTDTEVETREDESECSTLSKYYSTQSSVKTSPFCLVLYAWKIE